MTSIEKFNKLLRLELTVVRVYTQILKSAPTMPCFSELVANLQCHQSRADLIAGEIRQLKGRAGWLTEATKLSWTGQNDTLLQAMSILNEHEQEISNHYANLLHDHDFTVQLLAKRLHDRQAATLLRINPIAQDLFQSFQAA